jgi:hypothetical protein
MGQDAPPPLIRQNSRKSHHTDETSGKFTHTKKKNRKKPVFLFFTRIFLHSSRIKAAKGGVAFRSKKIERENRHSDG